MITFGFERSRVRTNTLAPYERDRRLARTNNASIEELEFEEVRREQWARARARVEAWLRDPEALADEDSIAPSPRLLELVLHTIERMEHLGYPPPLRVVPTSDGTLCLERGGDDALEVLEFGPDSACEYRLFAAGRLVRRDDFHLEASTSAA